MYNPGIDTIPDISLWWMGTEGARTEANGEEVIRMGSKPKPDPKPPSQRVDKVRVNGRGKRN